MTYWPKTAIYNADSPNIDAFGKLRVSEPYTLFDSKLIHDSGSLYWDESGSIGATFAYSQSQASLHLQVPATIGSTAVRQTKNWFNYQPGKSQLVILTANTNPQPGIRKRIGYFNTGSGLFWEFSGSEVYVVKRSSHTGTVIDTKVSQSDWNVDPLDGSGESGKNVDFTKSHIYFLDFEWLGVGRVRFGHYLSGNAYYTHYFNHENELNTVFMTTPNLPIRYEITNLTGAQQGSLTEICATVASEGGFQERGRTLAIDNQNFARSTNTDVTGSLVAIRMGGDHYGDTIIPYAISILSNSGAEAHWVLRLNPIPSTAFVWQDVSCCSGIQKATNVNAVNINGGIQLASGYVAGTSTINVLTDSLLRLGSKIDGTKDVLVLGINPIAGGSSDFFGSLNIKIIH